MLMDISVKGKKSIYDTIFSIVVPLPEFCSEGSKADFFTGNKMGSANYCVN